MLFSKIRFYNIKDLINQVKRPRRSGFVLGRRSKKHEGVEILRVRNMNQESHWKSVSLKPGCSLQPSLEELLRDNEFRRSFRSFLQSEFSEENLDFWLACEEFRSLSDQQQRQTTAQFIYREFLLSSAQREVNVDQWIREQIWRSLDRPSASCFMEAQKHVFALMEKDSWPRFTQRGQSLDRKSRSQWYI
ncbi:unnamed protein product [Knipowitschia caucasica]